jgi:hypothetical protein
MSSLIHFLNKLLLRKYGYIIIITLFAAFHNVQGQNKHYLFVIPAADSVKPNGNHRTMASPFIDSIFDHFEVAAYQYAFPGASNPMLAATCDIHAIGDIFELKAALDSLGAYANIELAEYYYIDPIVSVDEVSPMPGNIKIYPNPASGIVQVATGDNSTIEQLEVYDLTGKRILYSYGKDATSSAAMDVTKIPKGIYVLKIETQKGILSQKIVIR